MRRRLARWAVVAAVVGAVLAATPAAGAKSFSLPRIEVDARLLPDASMVVVERITYSFEGQFSFATRDIPPGPYQVTRVAVAADDGRPVFLESSDPAALRWSFTAEDEVVTFVLSYRVVGAAQVGPDVGELFWKFVGEGHQGVGGVAVRLRVPGDGTGVRAFAHGPLNGVVDIDGSDVTLDVDGLPGGQFVEGRVLVPSSAFTVAPSGPPRLDAVLAEERALAEAANAERARLQEELEERADRRELGNRVGPWLPLVSLGTFLLLWLRWGREHRPVADPGRYHRELPDDPPAVVSALDRFGAVAPVAYSATVLDLARRGHLRITETRHDRFLLPDRVEWSFQRQPPPDGDELLPHEQTALQLLFAAGPSVTQKDIRAWAAANESEAERRWTAFRREVKDALKARAYVEGRRWPVMAANVAVALLVALVAVAFLEVQAWGALAAFPAVVGQVAATPTLRRRTPAGAQRAAEWSGVRRYLDDFSELDEAPAGHLVLWERYLVYAVALGVAAQLLRGLAVRAPDVAAAAGGTWYVGGGGDLGGFASFGPSFGSASQAAFSPSSSGSGGGGGFSGGGGGGGGGGGYGAG